jgi:LruC domain-containing protein
MNWLIFGDDWGRHPSTTQHLVRGLWDDDRVYWVDSIGMRSPRVTAADAKRILERVKSLHVPSTTQGDVSDQLAARLTPHLIPWHGRASARAVNRRTLDFQLRDMLGAARHAGSWVTVSANPLVWLYRSILPGPFVYLRLDDYRRLPGVDYELVADVEDEVMAEADLVVATARGLVPEDARRALYLPQGVDFEHFSSIQCGDSDRRVLGFFGLLAEWIDFELIRDVANARPDWTLELLGPVRYAPDWLEALPNVELRPAVDYADLPAAIEHWSAAWIPFVVDEMTTKVNPLKAREYMAAGLPSAATPLPEIEPLQPHVVVAETAPEFAAWLDGVDQQSGRDHVGRLRAEAHRQSWTSRAQALARAVALAFCALITGLLVLSSPDSASAATYRETRVASTFQVYVPPNNTNSNRRSAIVVTAMAGTSDAPSVVDLIDDGADGDTDDSVLGVELERGESLVRYIEDGTVNDDAGGKWDGDYMRVEASRPVSVYLVTDSDWQHDWAPADNGLLRGQRFFVFANQTSVTARDVNLFAYEDNTRVSIYDVTKTALSGSGVARVEPVSGQSTPLISVDLNRGEDLNLTHRLGWDIFQAGRTYEVVATRPVTMLYGALGSLDNNSGARDGGGYVPGEQGTAKDQLFYFTVPHKPDRPFEQEVRIVSYDPAVNVELAVKAPGAEEWTVADTWLLGEMEHADFIGSASVLYRLTATGGEVSVYEANWLESGSIGTSDVSAFAPGRYGTDGSMESLVYIGPPGDASNTAVADQAYSHLYLFSENGESSVVVRDADTGGSIFESIVSIPASGFAEVRIDSTTYNAMNQPQQGLRPYLQVVSGSPIAVNATNWNDNWMAYATSVQVRNPEVGVTVPDTLVAGESATVTGFVENTGDTAIDGLELTVYLGPEVTYLSGTLGGQAEDQVTTQPDGQSAVVYNLTQLDRGVRADLEMTVEMGTSVSGSVVPVLLSATASQSSQTLASSQSTASQVVVPAVASLRNLVGTPGDRSATVSVLVDASGTSEQTVIELQRADAASGPFTAVGNTHSVAPGAAERGVTWIDDSVSNGGVYHYRVEARAATGAVAQVGPVEVRPADLTAPGRPGLAVSSAFDGVTMVIDPPADADVAGYRVYRREGASAWSLRTSRLAGELWTDTSTAIGNTYTYRVTAVDDDGNESPASTERSATPVAPDSVVEDVIVMFEDMIGPGANDWDYNDFIVQVTARVSYVTGSVSVIEIDYAPLARGAGYVHQLAQRIDLSGGWTAEVQRWDATGRIVDTDVFSGTGPLDAVIFEDTRDAQPAQTGSYANTQPGQTRFAAGQSARVTIVMDAPLAMRAAQLGSAPWDSYLILPYMSGGAQIHRVAYGGGTEVDASNSALASHALPFVRVIPANPPSDAFADQRWADWPYWALEGVPVWTVFPEFEAWELTREPTWRHWYARPSSARKYFSKHR